MSEKNSNEMRVKTQFGDLVAYPSTDPDNPGICLMFKPTGEDCEIDLAFVESKEDKDCENDSKHIHLYAYTNEYSEDYTHHFAIDVDKIKESLR